jgi:hypothetical protein
VVGVVVVVGDVVGVEELPLDEEPTVDVVVVDAEVEPVELPAPGCSLATATPMSAVDPVATIATARVRRRSRTLARRRALTASSLVGSGMDPSHHRLFRGAADRTVPHL